jgi:uncharacterized protein YndB with AHSA1/START domain
MNEPTPGPDSVTVERTMRAPPSRVFEAFLDPDLIKQWMNPPGLSVDRVSVDARVGGKILVEHSLNGESTGSFEGEYVKIDPPRELVYRWAFLGTEPEKGERFETLVSVTFRPLPGGKTRVTVVHAELADLRARAPQIYAKVVEGWTGSFEKMERVLRGESWPRGGTKSGAGT